MPSSPLPPRPLSAVASTDESPVGDEDVAPIAGTVAKPAAPAEPVEGAPTSGKQRVPQDLLRRVADWTAGDLDEGCSAELQQLIDRGDVQELEDRFAGGLVFGTAGLRGLLGAGPNRMNHAVVIRATAGLAAHLLEAIPNAKARGVVVGYDARRGSREFAANVAAVFAAAGIRVHLFSTCTPTPIVAFSVLHLRAAAGVVVTASHNPAEYNGYKVFWENGAQIAPPVDERIAKAISDAPAAVQVARLDIERARKEGLIVDVSDSATEAYLHAVHALCPAPQIRPAIRIVYTPVHGVGYRTMAAALRTCGFSEPIVVAEQVEPDGAFPTAPFPNPEEPGVLDRAIALAEKEGADLILANDPDADRLAVAIPADGGRFVALTGNQIGILLAHYLLQSGTRADRRLVLSTIVSSPMVGEIARAFGARFETTLTGFKWMETRAIELQRETGARLVFAYEEALGYSVGELIRDKDGIGAAVVFAELASVCRERGTTVWAHLGELYRTYGLFESAQRNLQRTGSTALASLAQTMRSVRATSVSALAGRKVTVVSDYLSQCRRFADGTEASTGLPISDVLGYELEGGARVLIRPSGTEPKLKIYLDHREPVAPHETISNARSRAQRVIAALAKDVLTLLGECK